MSAFSADWLALREAADHRSRSQRLIGLLAAKVAEREAVDFADLGCGTGSTLRAIAPALPSHINQRWRLYDHDPKLLGEARRMLRAWADHLIVDGTGLDLVKTGRSISVRFFESDLSRSIAGVVRRGDIVTASAFFDLVSERWIAQAVSEIAAQRAVLYAALNYNGDEFWYPPHPSEASMLAAFQAHQRRDKGFGSAAGAGAIARLCDTLSGHTYRVETDDSDWTLDKSNTSLIEALADGSGAAVLEVGTHDETAVRDWISVRRTANNVRIGHTDILAWCPDIN